MAVILFHSYHMINAVPDFRSPGGMYDTLRPDLITATDHQRSLMKMDPTYVVEKGMFLQNSFPYLEVRRPFILGTQEQKWKATISHRFFELLHTKTNKLTRLYTQNIDGLDFQCTDIPRNKIVSVHGTISEVACEACGDSVNIDDFCNDVKTSIKDIYGVDESAPKSSRPISCQSCKAPAVKPKTVLFGSSLPSEFFICAEEDLEYADLLIVAGTSLVVSPANSIVYRVNSDCMRMIVNMDQVGEELGIEYGARPRRDLFTQGPCEEIFLDLIDHLGWKEDLKSISDFLPPLSANLL